jgi:PHD/YefM family antitoxin component YafN of YafNO toxin-antitoxin module
MQHYISIPHLQEQDQVARQATISASEGHRAVGKLLKRIYGSDEHLIVERDGFPVAVIMSYQEYEQLGRQQTQMMPEESLPPVLSLEEAFGSVTPLSQPEDFDALREAAMEEHAQKVVEEMKD